MEQGEFQLLYLGRLLILFEGTTVIQEINEHHVKSDGRKL